MITIERKSGHSEVKCSEQTPIIEIIDSAASLLTLAYHQGSFDGTDAKERIKKVIMELDSICGAKESRVDIVPEFIMKKPFWKRLFGGDCHGPGQGV
jgi:hypothetical protein